MAASGPSWSGELAPAPCRRSRSWPAAASPAASFSATAHTPGVACADLRRGVPAWLRSSICVPDADVVVVSPHWGPNMVSEPVPHVRAAAAELLDAGATIIVGHSAHVFHGVAHRVLYDLGGFIDDYARDPDLHNELGLLWLVTLDGCVPTRVEAVPIALDYCHTRLADGDEAAWIRNHLHRACAAMGTDVYGEGGRFVIEWPRGGDAHASPRSPATPAGGSRT